MSSRLIPSGVWEAATLSIVFGHGRGIYPHAVAQISSHPAAPMSGETFGELGVEAVESLLHGEIVARVGYVDLRGNPYIVPIYIRIRWQLSVTFEGSLPIFYSTGNWNIAASFTDQGGPPVRKSRYSDEQIAAALRQAEIGTAVADITRKLEITEATFYAGCQAQAQAQAAVRQASPIG